MNLLIDAGNSRIKWAFADNNTWQTYVCDNAQFKQNFIKSLNENNKLTQILISSTRQKMFNEHLQSLLQEETALKAIFIWPSKRKYGVINRYQPYSTLGADRWASLVAIRNSCKESAVIISCGTAVTIDALKFDGVYDGGLIFPGIDLALNALNQTDNLHFTGRVDTGVLGLSTDQAIYSGVINSIAGAIDSITTDIRKKYKHHVNIYLSGGNAMLISDYLKHTVIVEPELVLKGLFFIGGYKN